MGYYHRMSHSSNSPSKNHYNIAIPLYSNILYALSTKDLYE